VYSGVALSAQRNQIFFRIIARVAPELIVVNLKVAHHAAELKPPSTSSGITMSTA
jgi:hypothetical protein